MLRILENGQKYTVGELAERLEVSKRMIEKGESYETIKLRLENIKNERDSLLDISDYKINNNDNINNTFKEFTRVLKKRRIIK